MNLLPQWPFREHPVGSEGAAQKREKLRFCTLFTAVFILLYGVLYFNFFHTGAYAAFKAASGILKVLSVLCALGSFYGLWKAPETKTTEKTGWYWVMFIGLFGAAWLFAYIEDYAF